MEKSFGMEIVSYVWKPKEVMHTYDVKQFHCAVRFLNEQEAIDFCSKVNLALQPKNPQVCVRRTIKNGEVEFHRPTVSYSSTNVSKEFRLLPEVEVESMPTPQQCLANIQIKGDKWIAMYKDKFTSKPFSFNQDKLNITEEVSA